MRSPLHLLPVFSLLTTVSCGGSAGTDLNQLVNENPFPDGGPGEDSATPSSGNADDGAFQDPFAGAPAFATQMGPSTHNPGMSCIQTGCHSGATSSAGAPGFLLGGTVYADYQGQTPAVGIEVRVADTQGHAVSVYSGPAGTFYLATGSAAGVTFPAVVGARDATSTRDMITVLTSGLGSCDQTACHVPGGGSTTNTGNYYPIHIP
jgi:hypothetical protein